jgi:hypothetical protein
MTQLAIMKRPTTAIALANFIGISHEFFIFGGGNHGSFRGAHKIGWGLRQFLPGNWLRHFGVSERD